MLASLRYLDTLTKGTDRGCSRSASTEWTPTSLASSTEMGFAGCGPWSGEKILIVS
jgi:hypothetical protein